MFRLRYKKEDISTINDIIHDNMNTLTSLKQHILLSKENSYLKNILKNREICAFCSVSPKNTFTSNL